jgi:predicted nucleotidyltransferase
MIDLAPEYLNIIRDILNRFVPGMSVLVFGSRINGKAGKFSDVDLAINSQGKLPANTILELKEAFSESDLPIKVDVVDISDISKEFRDIIKKKYIAI